MSDKYVEKFAKLSTHMAAYMRDVTYVMDPAIQSVNLGHYEVKVIGRAFTVKGPDIYMNALHAIPKDSVYVQGVGHPTHGVWCGFLVETYGRSRGLKAAVIDGGITNRTETAKCDVPTFAKFVSTRPAVNRKEGAIQVPIVCGGAPVKPNDIILADEDGVVVIPQENQEEIYSKIDAFLEAIGFFVEVYDAEAVGTVVTEHDILGKLFQHKYDHPADYWRGYEPWHAKYRPIWEERKKNA